MLTETTLNIHNDILIKICKAAEFKGISRSRIIILLLKKFMGSSVDFSMFRCIKYQDKDLPEKWHTFHIQLREDDYEFFLDLRKFFKMSVSLVLAIAVKKYIDSLFNKKFTDNYLFRNYLMIRNVVDGIINWQLYWGFPPKIDEIFKKEIKIE